MCVGDIGPKIGFNSKDNGYMILQKVVVPLENMLARFHKVTKAGYFVKQSGVGSTRIAYAALLQGR